jgi:catechol 2,3-dioxygenase-like lactoylglutathione lyase family enzyme
LNDLPYDGGLTCAMECADLQRSIAWYRDTLGFELLYEVEDIAWAELSTPVERVTLGLGQVEAPQTRGGATLTWGTTDLDAMRARLESAGVRFDGETQDIPGMVRLATFFDPDGNRLMLYEDLSGAGGQDAP